MKVALQIAQATQQGNPRQPWLTPLANTANAAADAEYTERNASTFFLTFLNTLQIR